MKLVPLAVAVNEVVARYVVLHDAIYGVSLWRNIRRLIPIPGVFEAIPYPAHAANLAAFRVELKAYRAEAGVLAADDTSDAGARRFANALSEYMVALDTTISHLEILCVLLATKATRQDALSLSDYTLRLGEYRRSQDTYVALGARLNALFEALPT